MLDPKIREAVQSAVQRAGQSPSLAQRLIAWLDAVTSGNEDMSDGDAVDRRLEQLYAETTVQSEKRGAP